MLGYHVDIIIYIEKYPSTLGSICFYFKKVAFVLHEYLLYYIHVECDHHHCIQVVESQECPTHVRQDAMVMCQDMEIAT